MVQKTIVTLVDDLTGEEAENISTVEFALDGVTYQLDLTDENRMKLHDALSPYAKAGFVSHQTHDFGSILKFIEEVFGLPTVGYADANADDLSDCFNFQQTPLTFQPITAKYDAAYFLSHNLPAEGPDDD